MSYNNVAGEDWNCEIAGVIFKAADVVRLIELIDHSRIYPDQVCMSKAEWAAVKSLALAAAEQSASVVAATEALAVPPDWVHWEPAEDRRGLPVWLRYASYSHWGMFLTGERPRYHHLGYASYVAVEVVPVT
jgi:hypothetical protein